VEGDTAVVKLNHPAVRIIRPTEHMRGKKRAGWSSERCKKRIPTTDIFAERGGLIYFNVDGQELTVSKGSTWVEGVSAVLGHKVHDAS
jgi:hypothetical protein